MSELNNEKKLEELKLQATDLGISFRENIGIEKLTQKIEEKEEEIAKAAREKKLKEQKEANKKVKIIVEPRVRDEGIEDQFFGFRSLSSGVKESILIQFGEEVEVSERMYEHIKSIKFKEKKFKTVTDADGIPKKEWYDKEYSRFIVSKV